MLRNRLRLRAGYEHSLDAANASADYPTRATAGAEYDLVPEATVEAVQEWTDGGAFDTRSTRLGLRSTPWPGGEARTSVEQQHREGALRVLRNAGLKQTWRLDERWSLDGGHRPRPGPGRAAARGGPGTPPAGRSHRGLHGVLPGRHLPRPRLALEPARLERRNADDRGQVGPRRRRLRRTQPQRRPAGRAARWTAATTPAAATTAAWRGWAWPGGPRTRPGPCCSASTAGRRRRDRRGLAAQPPPRAAT